MEPRTRAMANALRSLAFLRSSFFCRLRGSSAINASLRKDEPTSRCQLPSAGPMSVQADRALRASAASASDAACLRRLFPRIALSANAYLAPDGREPVLAVAVGRRSPV